MPESNIPINSQPDPMTATIEIEVAVNRPVDFDTKLARTVIEQILAEHRVESASISLAVVDDSTIHGLNRQFLDHDYPTDVLSFNLGEGGDRYLKGEIIVSADTAEREATLRGLPTQDELMLYVIHGALHLVGLDDKSDLGRAAMRAAEQQITSRYGIQWQSPDGEPIDSVDSPKEAT